MKRTRYVALLAAGLLAVALLISLPGCASVDEQAPSVLPSHRFVMAGEVPGYITVNTDTVYSKSAGYGWLDNAVFGTLKSGSSMTSEKIGKKHIKGEFKRDGEDSTVTGAHAQYIYPAFAVDLPPAVYDVRLLIGRTIPSVAGAKVEGVFNAVPYFTGTAPNDSSDIPSHQFITGRRFSDTVFRVAVWDGQLTVELTGKSPMLCAIEITPVEPAVSGAKPAVHIVGDSAASSHGDNMNAVGWGVTLPPYFSEGVEFNNAALSGASARSFIAEGRWNDVLVQSRPGDFALISWGSGDSNPSLVNHYASPDEFKAVLKHYADSARAFKVTPVLVTPFSRNAFNEQGQVVCAFESWNETLRQFAGEEGLFLVDLNQTSKNYLQEKGPADAKKLFASDNANLNRTGADFAAKNIGVAISGSGTALAKYAFSDVDRDSLRLAHAAAQVKNESLYTPASFSAMRDAVARVEAMPVNVDQAGVNASAAIISNAIAALERLPDPAYSYPPRRMEWLDRGLYAMSVPGQGVFLSWRCLGTDDPAVMFNLYRNGAKITSTPVSLTNFTDRNGTDSSIYMVSAVLNGNEILDPKPVMVQAGGYMRIPLNRPPGGANASGAYEYFPNDASAGDVDGDGRYELFVKWEPSDAHDNSQSGHTGPAIIDCYTLEGRLLWRVDLGPNIRAGAHYTQFMVYDLDGDGRAEMVCRTSDGSVDGTGKMIGAAGKRHANDAGHVLDAPEFLTVFDGLTGAAIDTVPYDPPYSAVKNWGDFYGNRGFRFLACIAYLDGVNPSVVMARGYYTQTFLVAYRLIDKKLVKGARFDSTKYKGSLRTEGQGNHSIAVADVNFDGKDDIIYGALTLDHNLVPMNSTGLGHGDAQHQGDLDPLRPGLEIFSIHEGRGHVMGVDFRDGGTGEVLWGQHYPTADVGRGLAADMDPRYPGSECFTSDPTGTGTFNPLSALYTAQGKPVSEAFGAERPGVNFAIWWDGDLDREILDHRNYTPTISKWNWKESKLDVSLRMEGTQTCNGTKATPMLQADLLGDWREEVLVWEDNASYMRLYMTAIPTDYRFYTLMHNPQYRNGIAWQNVAYNQPPNVSYFLGHGMDMPPQPNITLAPAPGKDAAALPERSVMPVVYIAGDASAQSYDISAKQAYDPDGAKAPAAGWGQVMDRFFKPALVFRNFAASGASPGSFIADGRLDAILKEIRSGDYLLIQFSQSDSSLQRYIDGAKQRGATPVILTPVSRLNAGSPASADAAKAAASENGAAFIDVGQMSRDFIDRYGREAAARELFLSDGTSFRLKGAIEIARLISDGLVKTIPAFAPFAGNAGAELESPGIPANFKVVSAGNGKARVTWSANPSASFAVYFRDSSQAEARLHKDQTANSCSFDSLENGSDYFVKVRAYNAIGISGFTPELKLEIRQVQPGVSEDFESRETSELPWGTVGGTTLPASSGGSLAQEIADAPRGNGGKALRIQGGARGAPRGLQLNLAQEVNYGKVEVSFDWYAGRPSDGYAQLSIQDGQASRFSRDGYELDNQFITFIANQMDNRVYIYVGNKNDNTNARPAARADIQIGRTLNSWVRVKVTLDFASSTLSYELRTPGGRVLTSEANVPFAPGIDYSKKVGSLRFAAIHAPVWVSFIDNLYIGEVGGK